MSEQMCHPGEFSYRTFTCTGCEREAGEVSAARLDWGDAVLEGRAMTLTPEQRAELRRLAEQASPGPWHANWASEGKARLYSSEPTDEEATFWGSRGEANASLAAAARNSLVPLLDALEEAERERDVFARYGDAAEARCMDMLHKLGGAEARVKELEALLLNPHPLTTTDRELVRLHAEVCDEHCEALLHWNPDWLCERRQALLAGLTAGRRMGAEAERAAVVAWLRDGCAQESCRTCQDDVELAHQIERGAHIPTEDPADGE